MDRRPAARQIGGGSRAQLAYGARHGTQPDQPSMPEVAGPGRWSAQEREFGQAGNVGALPRPDERRVARRGARANPDVILRVGLEPGAAEEVEPVEARQPLAHTALAIERPRILRPPVSIQGDVIPAREIVVANAGADRRGLDG